MTDPAQVEEIVILVLMSTQVISAGVMSDAVLQMIQCHLTSRTEPHVTQIRPDKSLIRIHRPMNIYK